MVEPSPEHRGAAAIHRKRDAAPLDWNNALRAELDRAVVARRRPLVERP